MKKYKFNETIPRQDPTQPQPNMTTYDPVPYGTFKRIEKYDKVKNCALFRWLPFLPMLKTMTKHCQL